MKPECSWLPESCWFIIPESSWLPDLCWFIIPECSWLLEPCCFIIGFLFDLEDRGDIFSEIPVDFQSSTWQYTRIL